jgi:hypothetical protein
MTLEERRIEREGFQKLAASSILIILQGGLIMSSTLAMMYLSSFIE